MDENKKSFQFESIPLIITGRYKTRLNKIKMDKTYYMLNMMRELILLMLADHTNLYNLIRKTFSIFCA